ncbi:DMT family transporter [Roseovarius aestuarii]|uniref:Putative amino-acid metabolite efflux pump n=1 Tax=Roseovarius aestuarii TaxID=475083 RepID=A0A1X7BQ16_9RHOB|nr:EamA family transporter [Roseovarius aestuarii]SMC11309.1 putative amino-acid metabolite efflux pump [Roseovarius aestuarii]
MSTDIEHPPGRLTLVDIVMGIGVALTWGLGIVFSKAAIAHFPPILLMGFRFTVTALVLVWFVRVPRGQLLALFGIALISAALQYSLTFTGLKGLDAGVAALVVQLEVPFLVLVGAVFLREKPGLRKWAGIAVAFFGVYQIAGEPQISAALGSVLLVISGAFVWAIGQAMIRKLKDIDGLTVTAWIAVMAAPQLFAVSLAVESDHWQAIQSAGWVVWATVLYLGLVMTALGYGLWYTLIRRNPVSQVAPFLLLLPLFAVLGGVVFLGESMTMTVMIGGAIVIAGVAIILTDKG